MRIIHTIKNTASRPPTTWLFVRRVIKTKNCRFYAGGFIQRVHCVGSFEFYIISMHVMICIELFVCLETRKNAEEEDKKNEYIYTAPITSSESMIIYNPHINGQQYNILYV